MKGDPSTTRPWFLQRSRSLSTWKIINGAWRSTVWWSQKGWYSNSTRWVYDSRRVSWGGIRGLSIIKAPKDSSSTIASVMYWIFHPSKLKNSRLSFLQPRGYNAGAKQNLIIYFRIYIVRFCIYFLGSQIIVNFNSNRD